MYAASFNGLGVRGKDEKFLCSTKDEKREIISRKQSVVDKPLTLNVNKFNVTLV